MEEENPKKFLVSKINAFESGSTNSNFLEQDTSNCGSICYQAIKV